MVLTKDFPQCELKADHLGTVVMIHCDHLGYELEIFSADGGTLDILTVEAS